MELDYLPRGIRGLVVPGHPEFEPHAVIRLAACDYEPHRQFSCAHELMEKNLPAQLRQEVKEQWCDRGAAALMMPRVAFLQSGVACDWWLPRLEEIWPHCSPYAILRRITDLCGGAWVSARVRDRIYRAVSAQEFELPADAAALEEFVAAEALHSASGWSEIRVGELRLRAAARGLGPCRLQLRRSSIRGADVVL